MHMPIIDLDCIQQSVVGMVRRLQVYCLNCFKEKKHFVIVVKTTIAYENTVRVVPLVTIAINYVRVKIVKMYLVLI